MPKKERVRLYDDDDLPVPRDPVSPSKGNHRNLPVEQGDEDALTKIEEKFIHQYTGPSQYIAVRAAIRAGYRPTQAHIYAKQLLSDPRITTRIRQIERERLRHMDIQGDLVAAHMFAVATADVSELVEVKTPCCRYCYGVNFLYQRTHGEFEEAFEHYNRLPDKKKNGPFDEKGGNGYDEELPPNPSCPHCFGRGDRHNQYVKVKDTAYMSPAARLLYAGAEQTKNGLKLNLRDQGAATNLIMRLAEAEFEKRRQAKGQDGFDITQMTLEQLENLVAQGREMGLSEDDDFPDQVEPIE